MKITKNLQNLDLMVELVNSNPDSKFVLNSDDTVDVDGNVTIPQHFTRIPCKFNTVNGYFWCSYTSITSLQGAPEKVDGYFWCSNTSITSLQGAPEKVDGYFYCYNNPKLTSLQGAPQSVGGDFDCSNTKVPAKELKAYLKSIGK